MTCSTSLWSERGLHDWAARLRDGPEQEGFGRAAHLHLRMTFSGRAIELNETAELGLLSLDTPYIDERTDLRLEQRTMA